MNEHEKIFTLETLIKDLIDFLIKLSSNFIENNEKVRERERVKRLKTFLDIRKDVEDELPVPMMMMKMIFQNTTCIKEKIKLMRNKTIQTIPS